MHDLIRQTIGFLGIEKPYKIIIKPKLKGNRGEYYGLYRKGKLVSHLIRISLHDMEYELRTLDTLIVHEFIHAWQEEKGITDIHGLEFQTTAKFLGHHLKLESIYIPGIDL
jgi:hypothetical protein